MATPRGGHFALTIELRIMTTDRPRRPSSRSQGGPRRSGGSSSGSRPDRAGGRSEAALNALEAQNGASGNRGAMTGDQRAPGTLSVQSGAIDLRETVMIGPDARLAMIETEARGIPGRARTLPGMMIPPWMKMSPPKN